MEDYIKLASQYPMTISPVAPEEGIGYYISSTYFPGILVDMETMDEAITEFHTVLADVIKDTLESGKSIPQIASNEYSGKMSLRMSKSLHQQLANQAELEGVSMNSLAVQYIAQGLEKPSIPKLSAPNQTLNDQPITGGFTTTYDPKIISITARSEPLYSTPTPNSKGDSVSKEM